MQGSCLLLQDQQLPRMQPLLRDLFDQFPQLAIQIIQMIVLHLEAHG